MQELNLKLEWDTDHYDIYIQATGKSNGMLDFTLAAKSKQKGELEEDQTSEEKLTRARNLARLRQQKYRNRKAIKFSQDTQSGDTEQGQVPDPHAMECQKLTNKIRQMGFSDAIIAKYCGCTRQYICNIRNGIKPGSPDLQQSLQSFHDKIMGSMV